MGPELRSARDPASISRMSWDGEAYQRRFDRLAARGVAVHGEADFVDRLGPGSVLDAGCGTGRVAAELARRGREVVGVDRDPSMLAVARTRAPGVSFVEADLCTATLGRRFAIVLMAGNVVLFTDPGTEAELVAGAAGHVEAGGLLVAGFVLDGRFDLADYDRFCAAAGLSPDARYATWDEAPFPGEGGYAVSVHVRPRSDGAAVDRDEGDRRARVRARAAALGVLRPADAEVVDESQAAVASSLGTRAV